MKKLFFFTFLLTFLNSAEQFSTIVSSPVSSVIQNASQAKQNNVIYVQLDMDVLLNNENKKMKDAIALHLDTTTEGIT